jgi:hypothetical protein
MGQAAFVSGEPSGVPEPASPGWYPDPWRRAPFRWWDGGSWTGRESGSAPAGVVEFVGGMNVPSQLGGRLNATVPCVVLTIGDGTLRMHPRLLPSVMFSDFEVRLGEIDAAFRLCGTFMTSGVGFELSDGQLAYFWTRKDTDRLLVVLQQRGIRIDPEPRRAVGAISGQFGLLWKRDRSANPSVAEFPRYAESMRWLMPVFMVLGIATIAVLISTRTPFGWFGAAVVALGVALSILIWRRHGRL